MISWEKELEKLNLNKEEQQLVELEEDLIETMIAIRKKKKLSQTQLAALCNLKQSTIARMEQSTHSPQIDSLLKVLVPMGYTLKIVPLIENEKQ